MESPSVDIDIRLKQLSYSSLLSLHSCPRRYQIYKAGGKVTREEDEESTTFAFGHVLGLGIQLQFQGKSEDEIFWECFQMWDPDLFAEDEKRMESFWLAMNAVQKFIGLRAAGLLEDYELAYYNGKPACELSFVINFPDGFRYRGYVDVVLRHKLTGRYVVLEIKSTGLSGDINEAVYKNSAQAIGYSIVLDAIHPGQSDYEVLYLPYKKKDRAFDLRSYTKSYLQRALWIQELLLDIESIKMYSNAGVFPMHGESCFDFYRQCENFGLCTLSDSLLLRPLQDSTVEKIAKEEYTISLTLMDLLESQLARE